MGMQELISHYEKKSSHYGQNKAIAEIYREEGLIEKLMQFVERNASLNNIMEYHKDFSASYPERALFMFRHIVNHFTEKNTGESNYKRIKSALKVMKKIKGGIPVVEEILQNYSVAYKRRTRMLEILYS